MSWAHQYLDTAPTYIFNTVFLWYWYTFLYFYSNKGLKGLPYDNILFYLDVVLILQQTSDWININLWLKLSVPQGKTQ